MANLGMSSSDLTSSTTPSLTSSTSISTSDIGSISTATDDVNNNVDIYNILIVPLDYLGFGLFFLFLCLWRIESKMESED